ncbi:MAG TPA: inositol monophosphatase family protein [Aestuariivirgaceae bacterium]|nr:inositol monophosphatase family protein [Aestuariivirgaceae bacterium]
MTSPTLTVMINAARKAARTLQRDFGEVENLQVSLKGPADFVTKSDQRAERILQEELTKARPAFGFVMEEAGTVAGRDGEHRWLIDPVDGTTNFIHGIPHFAISIGLERSGTIIAGVIYNPISNDLYTAERGRGAYLNDRRLRVAARRELRDAVIACGIPHLGRGDTVRFGNELARLQPKVAGVRRFGAAALDLAWVAAGRLDGYWERGLANWDIAAGILLVREAGGRAEDIGGGDPLVTGDVLAGNDHIFEALKGEIVAA